MSNDPFSPAHGLDRRGLLCAVGGVVAAAVVPAAQASVACVHSPEFLEFRRMVAAGELVSGVFKAQPPHMTDTAYGEAVNRWTRLLCRRVDIERAILARPPSSWAQAIELAELAEHGERRAQHALVDAVLSAAREGA